MLVQHATYICLPPTPEEGQARVQSAGSRREGFGARKLDIGVSGEIPPAPPGRAFLGKGSD